MQGDRYRFRCERIVLKLSFPLGPGATPPRSVVFLYVANAQGTVEEWK